VEPEYSQMLKWTGRRQIGRRLVPSASSRMDVYVNSPDRQDVATGFGLRNHFETLKSSASERRIHRFSASMENFAGVVGSLATAGEEVEERS
jgi:hypothetical protein